jgi:hypothetical protein
MDFQVELTFRLRLPPGVSCENTLIGALTRGLPTGGWHGLGKTG